MKSNGFTLIELMLVIAIIAIIAAIAIPNMLRSKMAANEGAAVGGCKAYAEAQDVFRRTDWNKDGVLEYAQSIGGSTGSPVTNAGASLFYMAGGNSAISLVDFAFSRAEGAPASAVPKSGFCFSVLTGQGIAGGAGTRDYCSLVVGSTVPHMTFGYGISCVPGLYDQTGRNTFQLNASGTVYQQDRGTAPAASTAHLSSYDPDSTWSVTE